MTSEEFSLRVAPRQTSSLVNGERGAILLPLSLTSPSDERQLIFHSFVRASIMRDQTVILNQGVSSWACRIPVSLSEIIWVRICLHREDALNRLNPSYFRKTGRQPYPYRDPDPRQEAQKARQLSKYIFPLQYGLSNVFSHASPAKESYKQPDFTDREREIEVRECIASYGGVE